MNKLFYAKLASGNLKKHKSLYLPYIITAIGMSAVYYIMQAITRDKGILEIRGGATDLQMILTLGTIVIAIFSTIFLFYTNSFLMKRRKKEFGLFNILGMEKRHIGKMMFWETSIVGIVCILGGLGGGVILNKLVVLLLLRITHLEVPFGFSVDGDAMLSTAMLFLVIFVVTLLYNLFQVRKARPIELLKSGSQGEAEPKTRWLLTIIGSIALAAGYYIAITTTDPMGTLLLFFVAVILVMIGTYCLFTAGSIAVLKMLRKNKKYYYQTAHFTSVSGMIYRMKQNAVGLANICILSTAVLVMVSGTISLYAGMQDVIQHRYPREISVNAKDLSQEDKEKLLEMVHQSAEECQAEAENVIAYEELSLAMRKSGEKMLWYAMDSQTEGTISMLTFTTLEEYQKMSGAKEELKDDEVLVYVYRGEDKDTVYDIGKNTFKIKKYIDNYPKEYLGENTVVVADTYYIIVKDETILNKIYQEQMDAYGKNASRKSYQVRFDITGGIQKEEACTQILTEKIAAYKDGAVAINQPESRIEGRNMYYVFCGGFLFLGVFLGFVFLMATVLIIYYKQISEGYEDKERYEIMRKVGMSHKEVKASIRSQILKVFFLPLVTAVIHLMAAFPLMNRLLMLFGMNNIGLFAVCALVTVLAFAVIYGLVYLMTAKTYYKIVE